MADLSVSGGLSLWFHIRWKATGASGKWSHPGTVAADRTVLPLNSRIRIYGPKSARYANLVALTQSACGDRGDPRRRRPLLELARGRVTAETAFERFDFGRAEAFRPQRFALLFRPCRNQYADGEKIVRLDRAILADGKELRVYH
jgi:hypothetical protein